ncbi:MULTISPECIES: helix-turn-helix domain-containing protein [Natrialbaceae]|uniref:Transcriptional regulator n=2 Tax=Natrialbaceae TaxID=1644061 RepID=A0A8J8Q562_9EURY|nr:MULTISPECIES: helix-turn-helix domain-containing protein [Natrialbaceae]RQH02282.1 transcriptional regulator [Natrarchaeobius chitinivorans]TYL37410.1 transcriptional regulator [Natronococcus pandeyae]
MTRQSSITDQLERDIACEGLLECLHGLKPLDRDCYRVMVESNDPLTIDEVAHRIDRERSTAYRSIQRLLGRGLLEKEQINYDQGGYYHVYSPTDPEQIATGMRRQLNDWYAKMGQLVQEFEDKYDSIDEPTPDEAF